MTQYELDQLEREAKRGLPNKDSWNSLDANKYNPPVKVRKYESPVSYQEPSMDASIEEADMRMRAIYGVPVERSIKIKSKGNKHFYEESGSYLTDRVDDYYYEEDQKEDLAFTREEHRVESTYRPRAPRGLNFTRRKIS